MIWFEIHLSGFAILVVEAVVKIQKPDWINFPPRICLRQAHAKMASLFCLGSSNWNPKKPSNCLLMRRQLFIDMWQSHHCLWNTQLVYLVKFTPHSVHSQELSCIHKNLIVGQIPPSLFCVFVAIINDVITIIVSSAYSVFTYSTRVGTRLGTRVGTSYVLRES